MRVAFVHDYLTQLGGAERVLREMQRLFPEAPIFTSLYAPEEFNGLFDSVDVRQSWLAHIPFGARNFRALLPLYPGAFERFRFDDYDVVISSSTSFAKGVRVGAATMHVCYMNAPTRFLWAPDEYSFEVVPLALRPALALALPSLRRWDMAAAQRPYRIVANSRNVAQRIRAVYGRQSDVIPCPADVDAFAPADEVDEYYLVAARLLPYKRVQLAVEACNLLAAPLVVIGSGPHERKLRKLAGPTIRFAGHVRDEERVALFARARAVIVPGVEDFGLVPIEAAAAGRPTIAFAAGGALETVVEGATGTFFHEPTAEALAAALSAFSPESFDRACLVAHAREFSPSKFRQRFAALLQRYDEEFRKQAS